MSNDQLKKAAHTALMNSDVWDTISLIDGSMTFKEPYKLKVFLDTWLDRAGEAGAEKQKSATYKLIEQDYHAASDETAPGLRRALDVLSEDSLRSTP